MPAVLHRDHDRLELDRTRVKASRPSAGDGTGNRSGADRWNSIALSLPDPGAVGVNGKWMGANIHRNITLNWLQLELARNGMQAKNFLWPGLSSLLRHGKTVGIQRQKLLHMGIGTVQKFANGPKKASFSRFKKQNQVRQSMANRMSWVTTMLVIPNCSLRRWIRSPMSLPIMGSTIVVAGHREWLPAALRGPWPWRCIAFCPVERLDGSASRVSGAPTNRAAASPAAGSGLANPPFSRRGKAMFSATVNESNNAPFWKTMVTCLRTSCSPRSSMAVMSCRRHKPSHCPASKIPAKCAGTPICQPRCAPECIKSAPAQGES